MNVSLQAAIIINTSENPEMSQGKNGQEWEATGISIQPNKVLWSLTIVKKKPLRLCKLCLSPEHRDNVHMSMPWFVWAQQTAIKSFLQLVTGFLLGGKTDSLNIGWQASFFFSFFYSALLSLHFPCTIHPSTSTYLPPSALPLPCFSLAPHLLSFPDSSATYYIFHRHLSSPHLSRSPVSLLLFLTHPIQPSSPPPISPCPSSLAHAAASGHHGSKPRRLPHA